MIDTRLTRKFGLTCPIVLAPMRYAAGGKLAAAVSRAGGLGLIGDGGCDPDWIKAQFNETSNEVVGCGLTTWQLARTPIILDRVLENRPRAILLAYGDPRPVAPKIKQTGIPLICQVHSIHEAQQAVEAQADIIVAQGRAAGGWTAQRSTMTLVPEIADFLYRQSHDTLLLAAGGIADSRGLAASIVMGADGVVMGTRLWASQEALVPPGDIEIAMNATGDDTRTFKASEVPEHSDWPKPYENRMLTGTVIDQRTNDPDRAKANASNENLDEEITRDLASLNIRVGEGIGLIQNDPPVSEIINTLTTKAERLLTHVQRKVIH